MNTYDEDAIYNPTINRQLKGVSVSGSQLAATHARHICDHGPVPRNYYVERKALGDRIDVFYADHSIDDTIVARGHKTNPKGSYNHPLSPAGLKENPNANIFKEFTDTRPSVPGFFQPPCSYVPGDFKWKHHENWHAALADAATAKGVSVSETTVADLHDQILKNAKYNLQESHTLYHPADRDTAIFKDEPAASLVASQLGSEFSLIIVCPYVRADGVDWNRFWDTRNRPPIITRWSTGEQGVHEPLILGCLPKEHIAGTREWYHKDAYWFALEPKPNTAFSNAWDSIALGLNIPDSHLGSWIWQYGKHIHACGMPHTPAPFNYDPNLNYGGRAITYRELTAWIMNPKFSTVSKEYAQRWDLAIEALIDHNRHRSDFHWAAFRFRVIALTRCANRKAGYACCFWLIIMGIFAKFAAALVAIPSAVLGGMTTFLFSAVAVSGIRIISTMSFTRRNRFILTAGFTLGFGATMVPDWFDHVFTYDGPNHALQGFYNAIILILETGFAVVAFINVVLNLVLPEEIEDEETPELTANEVDEPADKEEWARVKKGDTDVEGRPSSDIEPSKAA
ncbi:uncharacterized protein J4E88_001242 [Alternaria novae-zelandiae]|uniref:uncharacterized protein n=1 Tax=Alternaria novae-zelandiae TaxID=430562 RepID=UPI0020C2C6A5|nr:uncharacterized protein J4E88_001242 [Alternaria novae-zelandiae]KAI4692872.1 hypothetical protein J4E88_001242 [Alternaria novae-zelandiae]